MRRKTIKAKVSAALSASMVLAMLAPAMPAYAAAPGAGEIQFNFTEKNESVDRFASDLTLSGTAGAVIPTSPAPAGLQVNTGTGAIALPYMNDSGQFDATKTFKATGDASALDWAQRGLTGYLITAWYPRKNNGIASPYMNQVPAIYPYGGQTYYAELGPDNTKTYYYKVNHVKANAASGYYIPGLDDAGATPAFKNVPDRNVPVMSGISVAPLTIPGYKVVNVSTTDDGDGGKTVVLDNNFDVSKTHIAYDPDSQYVTGTSINKGVEITYKYVVDPSQTNGITVQDSVYKSSAAVATYHAGLPSGTVLTADNSPLYTVPRTVAQVAAIEAGKKIETITNIPETIYGTSQNVPLQGNLNLILPKKFQDPVTGTTNYTPARYILDATNPITVTYGNGKPNTDGYFTSPAVGGGTPSVIRNLIPAKDDAANNLRKITTEASMVGDAGHNVDARKVVGTMLNQPVTITFNYIPNPAYFVTLKVKYEDDQGNNITQKVLDKLADAGNAVPDAPGTEVTGTFYKEANGTNPVQMIYAKANNTGSAYNMTIEAPELTSYLAHPSIEVDDAANWSSSYTTPVSSLYATWSAASPKYVVSTNGPTNNFVLTVKYTQDPNAVTELSAASLEGGDLYVTSGGSSITYDNYLTNGGTFPRLIRKNINPTTHKYDLDIKRSDLPTPVPNAGYLFDKWTYKGQEVSFNSNGEATLTQITPGTTNIISLIANFKKDPNAWYKYTLHEGDSHIGLLNGSVAEIPRKDASGVDRVNIPWSEIQDYTDEAHNGISVEHGYTPKWYEGTVDPSTGRLNLTPIDTATVDLSTLAGKDLYVYGESTTPVAAYVPNVTGSLNSTTGAPTITIDPSTPAPMDSRLTYVITDPSGNVVATMSGADVMREGGLVTDPAIQAGNTYHVSTVPTTDAGGIVVGAPIPSSITTVAGPSAPATIPVAVTPTVSQDPSNAGQAMITINPTSPNTDYALVDPSGNVVYPFTTPSAPGAPIKFNNLNPNTIYRVVPRTTGTNVTPAARIADGATLPVDTSNIGLAVNRFNITAVANDAPAISNFKINGVSSTDPAVLQGLLKDTQVEIEASGLDNNSQLFDHWNVVSGGPLPNMNAATNQRLTFDMPNNPVTIQAVYSIPGQTWAPVQYNNGVSPSRNVGIIQPVITDSGNFRIVIDKTPVGSTLRTQMADAIGDDSYRGEFQVSARVQKENPLTSTWEDYALPSGTKLSGVVETGVLMQDREYKFYSATPSNATATAPTFNEEHGDYENAGSAYTGEFNFDFESGMNYVFGYVLPASTFKVKVIDGRDNHLVTKLTIANNKVVNDYASLYASAIQSDYVDNDGITWHYEGLSKDRGMYDPYDPTLRVTADETIYIYYSNDKADRKKAETDLKAAIQNANNQLNRINDPAKRAALQAAINAAQAVIDRINRKSSTPELIAAIKALNDAVVDAGGRVPNGGGGGRSHGGSGGGSGSAGRRASNGQTSGLRVGQDGNWELLNPAEATANPDSSKWVFNLTNGGRAKGWAYLSYTYEGKTKSEWYHFAEDGIMNSGWFVDSNNTWYYLSMNHNGFYGEMIKGWHHDGQDGRWYYLDSSSGAMRTNWSKIGGEYYFLNPTAPAQTWFFDNATGRWNFGNVNSRPLGSMYQNETTPDGYHVNESGAWR